jgi:predicted transcriptional regulator
MAGQPGVRIVFSTRVDGNLIKQLKHLAVDERKPINELLEEAIRLLLEVRAKERNEDSM